MTGVEILSKQTIYNTIFPEYWFIIGVFLFIACAVLTVLFLIDDDERKALGCVVLAIACIACMILSATSDKTSVNHIEYKVTIDDSVSMNEFLDKYEILDQEGKIYTVKERE